MRKPLKHKSARSKRLNLESLEARHLLASDIVMFNDVGVGANTNANATSYVANGTASGLLQNIETGEPTGITLSTAHVGAAFGTGGNDPQGSTDAVTIFDGFVDFGSTTASLIEIVGADTYTNTLSGLDPANLYEVAATAIRGNEVYFNRWTLVTLEGADSFTPSHSEGAGIVTDGLAQNQVAVWTGSNYLDDQGFVAQWLDIDPGPDGEFEIVSQQYQGATPGVGNGTANGIAGYAVSGLRLIEHDFDPASVSNTPAASVLATSAEIGATITDTGGLDPTLTLYWGASDGGTNAANWDFSIPFGTVGVGTYNQTLSGLASETDYFYRAFAQNAAGGSWAGSTTAFTTEALTVPTLTTQPVTEVGAFSATVSGVVTDPGGEAPIVTIYYGLADGGTDVNAWENALEIGERLDAFSAGLPELTPETEYFFRAHGVNAAGASWSPLTRSFTTGNTPLIAISEFMAQNNSTLTTRTRTSSDVPYSGEDDTPDWIEVHNLSANEFDVSGMHLTDNAGDPNQWQFPEGTIIPVDGYLVVFASGEDIFDPNLDERGFLHTNFSLSSGGEYVALTSFEGDVIDEISNVPSQVADISYGRSDEDLRYFSDATPGTENATTFTGLVADTSFSVDRGFYDAPFDVEITTATLDAVIRYTLDGSPPSESHGAIYDGPITISATSTLRAMASKPGMQPTNVDTQSYVFVDDVIQQTPESTIAAGFPTSWRGTSPDYGMDPDVIGPNDDFGGRYAATIRDDLKSLPTISIVGDIDDLFGSGGVYTNPESSTIEKPISVEMFTKDGSEEFQINGGVKIQGGAFRSWGLTKKKSLRLKFKTEYGPAKLRYPVFGEDATQEFDTLTLRMEANDGWQWGGANNQPQYARDEWSRRVQLATDQPASHGRFVHVYLNGVYWGMYNMVERPDQSFGEAYIGGDKDDWDGLNSGSPINADDATRANRARDAWNELVSLSRDVSNATTEAERTAAFMRVQGKNPDGTNNPNWESYLNVDNMIDYFIVNWYAANSDWPHKNYYVGRENGPDSEGFHFFLWDAEWSLFLRSNLNTNEINNGAGVAAPIQELRDSLEFRLMFADAVQEHLVNPGGALYVDPDNPDFDPEHPERNVPASIYAAISESNFDGLVAESARWGDQHRSTPYTRDNEWQTEYNRIMNSWFTERGPIFFDQLMAADLYPSVRAPVFQVNGQNQHGGSIVLGDTLSMTAAASIVTTDTTLVTIDAAVEAFVPTDNSLETGAGPRWYDVDFDTAGWTSGTGGVGFGSDYGDLIGTNVAGAWNTAGRTSVYTRYEFELEPDFDASLMDRLNLNMKFDDGYVVYLNGQLVHSVNAPSPIEFDARATGKRLNLLNTLPTVVDRADLSDSLGFLRPGTNVLAIQALNHETDMSDILVRPELILSDDVEVLAPIVYTLDGTDPRLLGGESVGIAYDAPIPLTETTVVHARALLNGQWSALNRTTFIVNPASEGDILVSEINYNPSAPTTEELTVIGTLDNDDFEFFEIYNRGDEAVDLLGASVTSGIDFEFPAYVLEPGERAVVVRDSVAFELRYGDDIPVIGEFADGSLNNAGEEIAIVDRVGNTLVEFEYDDTRLWPQRADGIGGTLELIAPELTPSDQLGKPYRWQGSTDFAGSPGTDGSDNPGVVISEVLAHTDTPGGPSDSIELHNPTAAAVNIGGWYLSDSGANPHKFQIPAETILEPGEYIVFDESDFNPTPNDPGMNDFALSGARGDDVWLTIGNEGSITRFVDDVHFGGSLDGVSFVRSPTEIGVVPSARTTLGCSNRDPRLPTLVISELNYNPGEPSEDALAVDDGLVEDDLEFVEIHNPTLNTVNLTNWRLRGGVNLDFDADTFLAPNETVVAISFNPESEANADRVAAFRTHYGIDDSVRLVGGFQGQLSDSGEAVRVQQPDMPPIEEPDFTPHVDVDEVAYDDLLPWPAADGTGESLHRAGTTFFGSFGFNWLNSQPTPGSVLPTDRVEDINGDLAINTTDLTYLADAVLNGNQQASLDIDSSGTVDAADVQAFLVDVLGSKSGDANLDGFVDGSDFNRWNDHKFQTCNVTLAEGDFNFDGVVDGSDFNIWSANRFTAVAPAELGAVARIPRAAANVVLGHLDNGPAGDHLDHHQPNESRSVTSLRNLGRRRSASIERRDIDRVNEVFASTVDELFQNMRDWI